MLFVDTVVTCHCGNILFGDASNDDVMLILVYMCCIKLIDASREHKLTVDTSNINASFTELWVTVNNDAMQQAMW